MPNTSKIELSLDLSMGRVSPKMECETAYTEVTYERDNPQKREKTVSRVFSSESSVAMCADQALIEQGKVVAIDTNTLDVQGRRRSVIGIVLWTASGSYGSPYCIELGDLRRDLEERIGWLVALNQLAEDGFIHPGERTALVVDASLGDLAAINRREQGLVGDKMLAKGWTMNYASADAGGDLLSTRLIKAADSAATRLMRALRDLGSPIPPAPAPGTLWGPQNVLMFSNSFRSWAELEALKGIDA